MCYVENVAMLKTGNMHLAHGSLGNYDILWDPDGFTRKQHKMKNLKNLKLVKTADNIPQVCCPRVEVVQCFNMFHEHHKTL